MIAIQRRPTKFCGLPFRLHVRGIFSNSHRFHRDKGSLPGELQTDEAKAIIAEARHGP